MENLRKLKPIVHIYIPEDSGKRKPNTTESLYLKFTFQRRLENFKIKFYTKKQKKDFWKAAKNDIRARNTNNSSAQDIFAIITDMDINANNDNTKQRIDDILKEIKPAKDFNMEFVNIYISMRCWEVWICSKNCIYNKPFTSKKEICKDVDKKYTKTEEWYVLYQDTFINNIDKMISNNKISRKNSFNVSPSKKDKDYIDEVRAIKYDESFLKRIVELGTISYVDLFVDKLNSLCNK